MDVRVIDSHIEKIGIVLDSIKEGKLTILVGNNGVGKSLIRKQLAYKFGKGNVRSVSMQLRTELRSDWGALSSAMHDNPSSPTSVSTFELIDSMFNSCSEDKKYFYIIDEPEIGMSVESQLGLVGYLKARLADILKKSLGVLIITHSEVIVEELKSDCTFINLGYNVLSYSVDDWLSREIKPTDFDFLSKWSSSLYSRLNELYRRNK